MFKSYIAQKSHQHDFAEFAARGPLEDEQIATYLGVKEWYVHSQAHGITVLARVSAFTWDRVYLEYQRNGVIWQSADDLVNHAIDEMLLPRGFVKNGNEWHYTLGDITIRALGLTWSVTLQDGTQHHNLSGPGECLMAIDHNTPYAALPESYHLNS